MDDSKKRKRDEDLVVPEDIPSKLLKENTSHELKTPKARTGKISIKLESPNGTAGNLEWNTPHAHGIKGRLRNGSKTPTGIGLKTPTGTGSKTPTGTGCRPLKTPNGNENKSLQATKTPKGAGSKTPKEHSAKRKGRLWCSDCVDEAGSGCTGHSRLDLESARHEAAVALRTALDTLQRLDELVQKGAPRLRCTAAMKGSDGEDVDQEDIEVALASSRLTENERRALCAYLEGLVLDPDWEHLSASSAGCEAIASKCAKLPDRPEGVTLKAGAILLLGTCDRGAEVGQDSEDSDCSDEDAQNRSWLGDAPPALRVYYGQAVMPHQARGAKVLGYIRNNISFFAMAKPRESSESEGEESNHGFKVVLSNVNFI